MKKFTLFILILIMFVGVFIPIVKVSAVGSCSDLELSTKVLCENAGFIWTENNSSTSSSLGCSQLTDNPNPKLQHLLGYATCIITKSVIPLIFALAVAMFVWGVVQYVINSSEEAKKEKGRQFMIWGIIALTVMVSVWGLVRVLGNTFGIEYAVPQVKSK